ncbi:MAG: hypothetical protein HY608_00240, partial [Planctomycetes bacterium]|nr:hypothetical protein [Planctomycetota bacterium]
MNSMTGFGEAAGPCAGGTLAVWIRTVNHKGLSVRVTMPDALEALADEAERQVRARLARGSVVVRIEARGAPGALPSLASLAPVARRLRALRAALRLDGPLDLQTVLSAAGGASRGVRTSPSASRPALDRTLGRALDALLRARAREGRALARDLR